MKCLWKLAPADIRFATSQLTSQLRTSTNSTYFSTLVELFEKAFFYERLTLKELSIAGFLKLVYFMDFMSFEPVSRSFIWC